MTATSTAPRLDAARTSTGSLVVAGLAGAALAAAATSTVAAVGSAAGISLEVAGSPIPVSGFAVLTAVFSIVGLVLAAALARWAHSPRRAFLRSTLVLTALSFVPDLTADAAWSTRCLLMLPPVVAASIVIPLVARRLAR